MKKLNFLLVTILALGLLSCRPEDPQLGPPPSDADAAFSFAPSASNDNIIEFTAGNQEMRSMWDLGNGLTATGSNVIGTYPNAGTYTVTHTIFNRGGSKSTTQEVVIVNDDPTLLDDPLFNALTGGPNGPGSKTWVIDSATAQHFGVGPDPIGAAGNFPEFYAAGANEKSGVGMYDDRFTFTLAGFQYDQITNGDVYVHNTLANDFPGSFENGGDYTAPYPDQLGETWTLTTDPDTSITVSNNSFIGFYSGVRTYRILELNDTLMYLQYKHHDGGLLWYLRLIPEGFVPNQGGGGGPTGYSLPIDFEGATQPQFNTFGGSTASIIANPDQSGINTSATVLETVHGNETWAGFFVLLDNTLDFSTQTNITFKIWAPTTGVCRVKVENSQNSNEFVELDVNVTTANAWEEITVDFSGSASGVYDQLVLFPGWNVANAGTFYIDDIAQQ